MCFISGRRKPIVIAHTMREFIKVFVVLQSFVFVCAAQCADPAGRPRGHPICNPVPALQHTEEDTRVYHCQEVRLYTSGSTWTVSSYFRSSWEMFLFKPRGYLTEQNKSQYYLPTQSVISNEPCFFFFFFFKKIMVWINIGLRREHIYSPAICGDAFKELHASFSPHPCSPAPLLFLPSN